MLTRPSLFLRRNDTGRIVGVTFIDHNERCVLNGSRLGKEFSANGLEERFGEGQIPVADLHRISEQLDKKQIRVATKSKKHRI